MTDWRKGSLAVLAAALLWSTGGLYIKAVSLDAWGVSFWRSSFAAVTLYLIYRRLRPGKAESWASPWVVTGAVIYAALLLLFVAATKLTTSANAIFLQYTAPIYVVFIEPLLSRSRLRREDLLSVAVSTAAMGLFFVGHLEHRGLVGNLAAVGSGAAFAAYMLLLKHDRVSDSGRWQCVILGHVLIAVVAGAVGTLGYTTLRPGPHDVVPLVYLGVVQIGLAYAFFTWGIQYVRALDATLISMAEPVLNPVWVFLGLGERPGGFAMAGGAVILCVSLTRALRQNGHKPAMAGQPSGA